MIKGKKIIQCGLCGRWFRKSRAYTLIKEGRRPQKIRVCADCYRACGYKEKKK